MGDPSVLPPDDEHRRPPGTDDATVAAVGKLSEAVEWIERARGRLFDFHPLIGHAIEEFDSVYYRPVRAAECDVCEQVLGGQRHVFEAELKERRRTPRRPGHESRPPGGNGDTPSSSPNGGHAVGDADLPA